MGDFSQSFQNHKMENIELAESSFEVTEKETPERKIFEVEEFIEAFRNLPCLWNLYPVIKTEQLSKMLGKSWQLYSIKKVSVFT